jgi:putative pyruvate formate lyase activating enzyme
VYCQNERISQENFGSIISTKRLREIFEELIMAGAHNIDLVNPTHFSHVIDDVLQEPLPVPVIWNSSGYDRVSTLRALEGKIQVYLPDFKYPDSQAALLYSDAGDYPIIAKRAIIEMVRQTGPYVLDEDGLLQRGVMIRHLLLPGRLQQAKEVMDWTNETFPPHSVLFSLMGQYVPLGQATSIPSINRHLRQSELKAATQYMSALGLEGYHQEMASAGEEFVPAFDLTGVSDGPSE